MPPHFLKNELSNKTLQKVLSICWGLLIVSSALITTCLVGVDKRYKDIIFLDDYFFGIKTGLFPLSYIIDILALSFIILLLEKGSAYGLSFVIVWASINLLENAFDVFTFSLYPHIIIEELLFVVIYTYLVWLGLGLFRSFKNNVN